MITLALLNYRNCSLSSELIVNRHFPTLWKITSKLSDAFYAVDCGIFPVFYAKII